MDRPNQTAFRLAKIIHKAISKPRQDYPSMVANRTAELLEQAASVQETADIMTKCRDHDWHAALAPQLLNLRYRVNRLKTRAEAMTEWMDEDHAPAPTTTSVTDIMADLAQIESEFESYEYDGKEHTLSVTTEPITLEEIELGRFEVIIDLDGLSRERSHDAYHVEAKDPNPAENHSDTTHPHVQDEHMCEGDASTAIHAALKQGRLCDFFMLVRAVLTTYNPNSPYVSLKKWGGGSGDGDEDDDSRSCHDCGSDIDDDNSNYCDKCQHDYCNECISSCECCETTMCVGCLNNEGITCPDCGHNVCESCVTECEECLEKFCDDCIETYKNPNDHHDVERSLCPKCLKRKKEDHDPNFDLIFRDRFDAGPNEPLLWDELDYEADTADVAERAVTAILEGEAVSDADFAHVTGGPDLTDGEPDDSLDDVEADTDQAWRANVRLSAEAAAMARGPALATAGV